MLSHLSHVEWPWLRLILFAVVAPLVWCFLMSQVVIEAAQAPARGLARRLRRR